MRVLVTGHKGFIGSNLVRYIEDNTDWEISTYNLGDEFPGVIDQDWVIHIGAISSTTERDLDKVMKYNYDFTKNLFDNCKSFGINMQYSSTASLYGMGSDFRETANCKPQTPYAWSKYLCERHHRLNQGGNVVQGFRYFNVYGKWMHLRGHRANAIHKWRQQARKEGKITVWETAEHVYRDWTWVGDVCRLHIDFIKTVNGSGIWNVGSGLPHSFLDVAEEIAEQEGVEVEFIPVPEQEKDRMRIRTCADLTKLKETVGKRQWLNVFEWLNQ